MPREKGVQNYMVYKGMIKINGTWIPTPADFTFNVEDIDSEAFRTQDGVTHRKRIGKVIKLNCKWDIVPDTQEYYDFFNLLDNLPEFFTVQFPHPNGTNNYTTTMYRGNPLTSSMRSYYNEKTGKISKWRDTSVNFIERGATKY